MRIVVAMDSFKGSLTSQEANRAVRRALAEHDVVEIPVSDGGEGFLDAWLATHPEAKAVEQEVTALDGRVRQARYGWHEATREAVVEVAEASGLTLVNRFDPWRYSSYGTGMQLRQAIERGAGRITIGLGGSATVDGGKGVLEALGVRFLDESGRVLEPFPHGLERVKRVDWSGLMPEAKHVTWRIASDVTNPLLGHAGAAAVFGPQKGLAPSDVARYDDLMSAYAACFDRADTAVAGAGAAGGIGFAMYQLGATYVNGIEEVMRWSSFDAQLHGADWLITGEGRFDEQSLHGKAPYGLARFAHEHGVPTLVFTGQTDMTALPEVGIEAIFPIISRVMPLETALMEAAPLLTNAVTRAFRLIEKTSKP
ncbi:glycerate kinase family protein [Exiguobacterium aurantiacum]|uniref:glycerate kinase family protein n=1 Tax=Exiguobacterium aurantiacum TaxID=33987 RepID=UPI0008779085|nr:glycerate kinase [Exiguobacterium aurantiacum]